MSLEDVPTYMGTALGIDPVVASLLLTVSIIMALIIPTAIATKNQTTLFIMLFIGMSISVGLGWLPAWFEIIAVVIIAMGFARNGSNLISGD